MAVPTQGGQNDFLFAALLATLSFSDSGATNRIMSEFGSVAVAVALLIGTEDPVQGARHVMLMLVVVGVAGVAVALRVDT